METTVTIPSKDKLQKVIELRITPGSGKIITVIVTDPEKGRISIPVDVSAEWSAATATQQTTIKNFFKAVAAMALDQLNATDSVDVTTADVTGEVFE